MSYAAVKNNLALRAYLECALWSSTNEHGEPLDKEYSLSNFAPSAIESAEFTVRSFLDQYDEMISEHMDLSQYGHDLWLTRSSHGAGFWSRSYPKHVSDTLTRAAHALGDRDVYVSDDGMLYFS